MSILQILSWFPNSDLLKKTTLSAGAVEYTDCTATEGWIPAATRFLDNILNYLLVRFQNYSLTKVETKTNSKKWNNVTVYKRINKVEQNY